MLADQISLCQTEMICRKQTESCSAILPGRLGASKSCRIENLHKLQEVGRLLVHARLGAGPPGLRLEYVVRPSRVPSSSGALSTALVRRCSRALLFFFQRCFDVVSVLFLWCCVQKLLRNFQNYINWHLPSQLITIQS